MSIYLKTIVENSYTKPLYSGDLDACAEQGEAASDECVKRDANPYPEKSAEHDSWDYGWTNSLAELCGMRR